jgi:hypothetical protein
MTFRCPRCSEPLIKSQAGRLKLRLPMIAFRADGNGATVCETVCPGCRADVPLPLAVTDAGLAKSMTPALPAVPPVRLTISPPQKTPLTPAPAEP